ncbi:hypothetical protein NicSoilE8_24860 [Arthrobacter sp. NicSoilE8]|nr:hypothetical protein NicSoilE8_24860 [Arthrobacter sp. NicSoilE8]
MGGQRVEGYERGRNLPGLRQRQLPNQDFSVLCGELHILPTGGKHSGSTDFRWSILGREDEAGGIESHGIQPKGISGSGRSG